MKHTLTITPMHIGPDTVLRIPGAWQQFVYRGFLYQRDEFDRFVVVVAVEKKTA